MTRSVVDKAISYIQLVSIPAGIVLGLISFWYSQWWRRKAQTMTVIGSLLTATPLDRAYCEVIRMVREGKAFDLEQMKTGEIDDLIRILNYYEFLCTSLKDRVIDERVVVHLIGGSMASLYGKSHRFVSQIRAAHGRPSIYPNLEAFFHKNSQLVRQA